METRVSVSKKHSDYLTPEKIAEHTRVREAVQAELPEIREHARAVHENAMRNGTAPRTAVSVLRHERKRQGLTDDEMIARSGLDRNSLTAMSKRDADPTIKTLEAYAQALGKKLLIVLTDEGDGADYPS